MIQNKKIEQRLKTLKSNIDAVNLSYKDSIRDYIIDSGLEYHKSYPFPDKNTLELLKNSDELKQLREDKLFDSIFNFSQIFYSIKEYLRKEYPQSKQLIEDFFSNEKIGTVTRTKISNDLKHNPDKDLIYGVGKVKEETIQESKKTIYKMYYRQTYFYSGIDSVELCNSLYCDLMKFINDNF